MSNATDIKSVQIIKIERSKIIFNYDTFQDIINQNEDCHNLPVSVIIINGALRTGKSFFSNFIIRHLLNLENSNSVNKKNNIDILTDYFISRRGYGIQTIGIWVLNKIFRYNGMGIVLMDTQGIFDQELNQDMSIALVSLSTIMSCYQIYNLDKRIQEDYLCNMAYFSAYSSLASNKDNSKIGQLLCILVRDWENFENNYDLKKCIYETERYKREIFDIEDCENLTKIETIHKLANTYDDIIVRLCPHPGHLVTEGKFSGNLSDIRDEFKIHVNYIIDDILKKLKPKRITSQQTLSCGELAKYMKEFVVLYENSKKTIPESSKIIETTEKICQENAKIKTIHYYKHKMISKMKTMKLTHDNINAWHNSYLREAKRYFNKLYIMGNETDIKKIYENVIVDIDKEHKKFMSMACDRGIFDSVRCNMNVSNKCIIKNAFVILLYFIAWFYFYR